MWPLVKISGFLYFLLCFIPLLNDQSQYILLQITNNAKNQSVVINCFEEVKYLGSLHFGTHTPLRTPVQFGCHQVLEVLGKENSITAYCRWNPDRQCSMCFFLENIFVNQFYSLDHSQLKSFIYVSMYENSTHMLQGTRQVEQQCNVQQSGTRKIGKRDTMKHFMILPFHGNTKWYAL